MDTETLIYPGPYNTLNDIENANSGKGQFWFSPDTMRFFKCRVQDYIIGGRLFISGERGSHQDRMLYTIRVCDDEGNIDTIGEFQQYTRRDQAEKAAQKFYQERRGNA